MTLKTELTVYHGSLCRWRLRRRKYTLLARNRSLTKPRCKEARLGVRPRVLRIVTESQSPIQPLVTMLSRPLITWVRAAKKTPYHHPPGQVAAIPMDTKTEPASRHPHGFHVARHQCVTLGEATKEMAAVRIVRTSREGTRPNTETSEPPRVPWVYYHRPGASNMSLLTILRSQ